MSRQDISVDAVYGECNLTDNLTNKVLSGFVLLDENTLFDNEKRCYGEIILPPETDVRNVENCIFYVPIDYFPVYKDLYLRLRVDRESIHPEYIINKTDNGIWFPVYRYDYDERTSVKLSELMTLNENGIFQLIVENGYISMYSGNQSDFIIKASLQQNEIFLLKAFAGNLYQYPTTGVGLIDFLHGNFENTGLADKLQQEFSSDRMVINNAYMDSQTGVLYLEVSEKDG